jgi:hypothetical protein
MKNKYIIDNNGGTLTNEQLRRVLDKLPLVLRLIRADAPTPFIVSSSSCKAGTVKVDHGAQVITIMPPKGKRIAEATVHARHGRLEEVAGIWRKLQPDNIFTEDTGNVRNCYHFDVTEVFGITDVRTRDFELDLLKYHRDESPHRLKRS